MSTDNPLRGLRHLPGIGDLDDYDWEEPRSENEPREERVKPLQNRAHHKARLRSQNRTVRVRDGKLKPRNYGKG